MTIDNPSDKTKYTCPMHPEIIRDEPGDCPKCGMTLQPVSPSTGVARPVVITGSSEDSHEEHQHHKTGQAHKSHLGHTGHDHGAMVADFKKRLWICFILMFPVLALSPMIQHALGLEDSWRFAGDTWILTVISSIVYFYGGWSFLTGLKSEISARNPGMMTLIGVVTMIP